MEIVKSAEAFKKINDSYKFSYLQLIVRKDGRLGPKVKSAWTVLDSPHDYYVKTPDLWAYTSPNLGQQITREVEACELLKTHPRPNIAVYGGCRSTNGRVSGIYFQRYTSTLQEKVNPQYLSKSDFLSSGRPFVDDATKACLDGILAMSRPVRNSRFSSEDDELLLQLKGEGLSWDEISDRFPGRSKGTLQVHYSTKLKPRSETSKNTKKHRRSGLSEGDMKRNVFTRNN
ncbi:serine/threonine-protein kinase [Halenospora varia]|nr:serine/threonine-protein kinase [Halenospora varia]